MIRHLRNFPAVLMRRLPMFLIIASLVLLAIHIRVAESTLEDILPSIVYEYGLDVSFEGFGSDVSVSTYLPQNDERQRIIDERIVSGALIFDEEDDPGGRLARWRGNSLEGPRSLRYSALISTSAVRYDIPSGIPLAMVADPSLAVYLKDTKAIPSRHREIVAAWEKIRPTRDRDTRAVLQAIHRFTRDGLAPVPFKGMTDALTALRLGEASCNGKSRVFVAMARLNGIPARLVGGVILTAGAKRTSHQWVEAWVGDRWVPFCPLNDHFGELPANYLRLYEGDEALFSHTRDINFDYAFQSRRTLSVQPGIGGDAVEFGRENWVARALASLGLNYEFSALFLLFPFAALVVTFCRNVVGMRTFGIFLPMLVGAGCWFTGLVTGLIGFVVLILIGALAHRMLSGMRLLLIPRLAVVMTLFTVVIVAGGLFLVDTVATRVALLALFPVVILSFAAERLHQLSESQSIPDILRTIFWTLLATLLCYAVFSSSLLRGVVFNFPEVLFALLGIQIAIGRWTGIRALEYRRFSRLFGGVERGASAGVLGINARNIDLVAELNSPVLIRAANDKLETKRRLETHQVPTPKTIAVLTVVADLDAQVAVLREAGSFAMKPAHGAGGNGIILVRAFDGEVFHTLSGETLNLERMRAHVRDVVNGLYSGGDEADAVLIEALIEPDDFSRSLYRDGIADIRILMCRGEVLAAMLRIPTATSGGKANLHQGGAGFGIDLESGQLLGGVHLGQAIEIHPDTGERLTDRHVPDWSRVLAVARAAQVALPLGYTGIDVCLDRRLGPIVLEVNARPGLEIQNALGKGLVPRIAALRALGDK